MFFAGRRLADNERVFGYPPSMKTLDGSPGALRGDHGYEAETARLLMGAFDHNINFYDIAVGRKEFLEFVLRSGCGDIINMYFGGHNHFPSLSPMHGHEGALASRR